MVNIIYFSLHIITFLIIFYSLRNLNESDNYSKYWKKAVPGIIVFALNEGLRWGRGIDYNYYFQNYYDAITSGYAREPFFIFFCKICNFFSFDYYDFILVTSLLLAVSIYSVMINYKQYAYISIPFYCILMDSYYNNLIRWYLGAVFIFIGLSVYLRYKNTDSKISYAVFIGGGIIAMNFHTMLVVIPPLYWIVDYYTTRKEIPLFHPFISIALFFASILFFDNSMLGGYVDVINYFMSYISIDYSNYTDNMGYWLIGGSAGRNYFNQSIFYYFFILPIVYYGYILVCEKREYVLTLSYNFFIIGFILFPISYRIELLQRIWVFFYMYAAIIVGALCEHALKKENVYGLSKVLIIIAIASIGVSQIRAISKRPDYAKLYIWDRRGDDVLDVYSTWLNHN